MARHVLHGEVSAFFWGQSYGGTQEVFPVAALFWVFGTHLFLMRIVPIACSVVAGIIVWRIARRELGELQGIVAGLLLWIWPVYAVWKIEVWSGFYGGGLIYASLVLLLTLRLDRAQTRLDSALMGLVVGLGAVGVGPDGRGHRPRAPLAHTCAGRACGSKAWVAVPARRGRRSAVAPLEPPSRLVVVQSAGQRLDLRRALPRLRVGDLPDARSGCACRSSLDVAASGRRCPVLAVRGDRWPRSPGSPGGRATRRRRSSTSCSPPTRSSTR